MGVVGTELVRTCRFSGKILHSCQFQNQCNAVSQTPRSYSRYLHIQLFSRFRDYFGTILIGLPFILVVPLTIRLHKYPIVLVGPISIAKVCDAYFRNADPLDALFLCISGCPVFHDFHHFRSGPDSFRRESEHLLLSFLPKVACPYGQDCFFRFILHPCSTVLERGRPMVSVLSLSR